MGAEEKASESPARRQAWWAQVVPALLACVVWGVASSSIILLNKSLISEHDFKAPMLLASLGQFTAR
jgi:hypothetical protein